MMKYHLSSLVLVLFFVSCQRKYEVGFSRVSIEPTDETVSLALTGYGNPYLGRFTLTWDEQGELPDVSSMTLLNEDLYLLGRKGELSIINNLDSLTVKKMGNVGKIKYMAGYKGLLYGITQQGEILTCDPAQSLQWEKVGNLQNVTSFTASTENLYATTADSILWMGSISGNDLVWTDIGEAIGVVSLTCDTKRLYAVTTNGWLMQRPLKRKSTDWLRIGYNNRDTYTINAELIIHGKEKLYALASNGKLYRSRHSTAGDLSANAMAIRKGKSTVVIAGVDVCGFDYSFTQSIKQEISQRKAIPVEAIMINASHTHFAPVTQKWLTWLEPNRLPDSLYLNNVLRKGIIQAIEEALDNMETSYLFFGRDTTAIGFNRRLAQGLKKEEALYDQTLDVLKVTSINGQTKSLIFLAGCHPVFTDAGSGFFNLSSNYPGYARNIIEEKTGAVNTIFLQGCAADIDPKGPFKTSGRKLSEDVLRVLDKKMMPVKGAINFVMDSLHIPTHSWSNVYLENLKADNSKKPRDGYAAMNVNWANMILDYNAKGNMPGEMPIYVQTLNIGDWKLVGLSREATTEFGMAIRKIWHQKKVSVAAYTNDVSSYLSTAPYIKGKHYEGFDSFFLYGQPSLFPEKVFDTVIEFIKTKNR